MDGQRQQWRRRPALRAEHPTLLSADLTPGAWPLFLTLSLPLGLRCPLPLPKPCPAEQETAQARCIVLRQACDISRKQVDK